jgi:hypothetical protein
MNVTFTLTAATSGTTAAGPFNISGTTSGNTTTELATGITKNQLTTGYTINSVNDAITGGTIASTGSCNTTTTWSVIQPTPTPTPTATPTGFRVELSAMAYATLSPNPAAKFLYRIGSGSWTPLSQTTVGTGYGVVGDILNVPSGSNVDIAVQNTSGVDVVFGHGQSSSFIGNCGKATPYTIFNVLADDVYYVNLNVVSSALVTC